MIEIDRIRRTPAPELPRALLHEPGNTYCDSRPNPAESYAARFAGKEAVGKALGCGVRFTWKEIEIAGQPKPGVALRLDGRVRSAWAPGRSTSP